MKSRRFIFRKVIAPTVAALVIVPTLAIAVWETLHGRGAFSYSNVYGLSIPYVAVLITVAVLVLTVAGAYIARLLYLWRNRSDSSAKITKLKSQMSREVE
jgi:hypothetical protein